MYHVSLSQNLQKAQVWQKFSAVLLSRSNLSSARKSQHIFTCGHGMALTQCALVTEWHSKSFLSSFSLASFGTLGQNWFRVEQCKGMLVAIFGNVGNLVNIGPFTLMVARVLSLRRAALAGHPFYHLVDRLVHQCFCSRGTARGDDRAYSLKKRVRYL